MNELARQSDEALARRVASGCADAFAELDRRYRPRLLLLMRRRVGNAHDAEDLTQHALARAYEKIDAYDPARPFKPWLFTIAIRLSIDLLRRPANQAHAEVFPETVPVSADPHAAAEAAEDAERRSAVWRIADDVLTEKQRTLLWLAYVEQLTPTQIAKALKMTSVHARVSLHRARKALAPHVAHLHEQATPEAKAPEPPEVAKPASAGPTTEPLRLTPALEGAET